MEGHLATNFGQQDMPALFRLADRAATKAQAHYFTLIKVQLGMLLVGSVAGICVQVTGIKQLAYIGVAAYAVLVVIRLNIKVNEPDKIWYENRQVAESVKSLAWRYSVGGAPFEISSSRDVSSISANETSATGTSETEADQLLSERLAGVIRDASHVPLPDPSDSTEQITTGMRETRRASFDTRVATFAKNRIEPQLHWYASKAKEQAKKNAWLDTLMLGASGAAVCFGFAQALGVISVNLLGLAGISAAIVATWQATTHYSKQASTYSIAAHQLTLVQTMIGHQQDEDKWAGFVNDAEDGISREHTSWRVARAQP